MNPGINKCVSPLCWAILVTEDRNYDHTVFRQVCEDCVGNMVIKSMQEEKVQSTWKKLQKTLRNPKSTLNQLDRHLYHSLLISHTANTVGYIYSEI